MGIKVPSGLPVDMAALTEPLAVGVHAVAKSRIAGGDAAIVLGLGPVGLACIAELKMRGIGPIVAADFSPKRRALAEQLGADVVVDPRETPAIEAWRRIDGVRPLVIFEAVGVPGMIEQAMRMAPKDARILVVGAHAVLRRARQNPAKYPWLTQLLARRPFKVVAVALANKMARVAWALLARGGTYRSPELAAA
jgi:threonine dehydrogenase-like Zn-dependent dehydrogenase